MNIPKGYKLVPVEPTDEMEIAGGKDSGTCSTCLYGNGGGDPAYTYRAMLAAAPTPPQPIYDESAERELFNTWYAKNIGVLGTSTWAEYIGVWMACAQSRAKAGEDE